MKFRENNFHDVRYLAGKAAGKPVWIVGSDPTLDGYPEDFLDGKIAITLHLAHVKFPRATFRYTSEYDRAEFLIGSHPEYCTSPLISAYPVYGKTIKETRDLLRACNEVYFHRMVNYLPTGVRGEVSQGYTTWKVARTIAKKSFVWGSHGSCLHMSVYAALLLGASEIHVIGAGHNLIDTRGLDHFSAVDGIHQNMRVGDTFTNPKIVYPVIAQTLALQQACEKNGIPFYWHARYTPSMNEYVTASDELLADLKKRAKRTFGLVRRAYRLLIKRPYTILFQSWR